MMAVSSSLPLRATRSSSESTSLLARLIGPFLPVQQPRAEPSIQRHNADRARLTDITAGVFHQHQFLAE